jgi:hypothetical protein
VNRYPEEATCKTCPHWDKSSGDGMEFDDIREIGFGKSRTGVGPAYGCDMDGERITSPEYGIGPVVARENHGCPLHPYWSRPEPPETDDIPPELMG